MNDGIDEGLKDVINNRKIKLLINPVLVSIILFWYNKYKNTYSSEDIKFLDNVFKQFKYEVKQVLINSEKYEKDIKHLLNTFKDNQKVKLDLSEQDIIKYLTNLKNDSKLLFSTWKLLKDKSSNQSIIKILDSIEGLKYEFLQI